MTPDEQIRAVRHYTEDRMAIAVFENGTLVAAKSLADAAGIMAAYDVPNDGQGFAAGDMNPLSMDDNNTLIVFAEPRLWKPEAPGDGQAFRVASGDDLIALAVSAPRSRTEVFQTTPNANGAMLMACLGARTARTKDSKTLKVVASWSPPAS